MGIGGVVANVGFKDYLLSPRQWEIYRHGMRKASDLGMILWLYDEHAYPSGSAGGIVTRATPEYAAQGLACSTLSATAGQEAVFDQPLSCKRFEAACALELATLQALEKFCAAGGPLVCVGEAPTFADNPKNQPAFDALLSRLPIVRAGLEDLPGALQSRIEMDFQLPELADHVFYLHRRRDGRDIYCVVNNRPEPITLQPKLRAPGPFTLDRPLTASCGAAPDGLRLELGAYEGVFLVSTEPL